jgi:hypothetical protein
MSKTDIRLRRGVPYGHGDVVCRAKAKRRRIPPPPTGGSATSAAATVDIKLDNVPYVYQEDTNGNYGGSRSSQYCGLASARMIRTKKQYGTSASSLHDDDALWMFAVDKWLQSNTGSKYVNIGKTGLVYAPSANSGINAQDNYQKTQAILKDIYLSTSHPIKSDQDTSRVSALLFQLIYPSNAMDTIWNHIKNNNEPVVVIVDSNLLEHYFWNNSSIYRYPNSGDPRMLHYVVIAGIREKNSVREFYVYDPLFTHGKIYYDELELRNMMTLELNRTAAIPEIQWVFDGNANFMLIKN